MKQSYYDVHAKEYAELTVKADMSPAYDRFLAYLPAGAGDTPKTEIGRAHV